MYSFQLIQKIPWISILIWKLNLIYRPIFVCVKWNWNQFLLFWSKVFDHFVQRHKIKYESINYLWIQWLFAEEIC